MKRLAFVLLLSCICIASKKPELKDSDWSTGRLVQQESERQCGESPNNCKTITHYRVDAGDMVYVFSRTTWPIDHLLSVTTNAPIKYAVREDKAYLLDEKGKQHKLDVTEKIHKLSTEPK